MGPCHGPRASISCSSKPIPTRDDSDLLLPMSITPAGATGGLRYLPELGGGSEFSGRNLIRLRKPLHHPRFYHNGVTFVAAAGDEGSTFGPEWPATSKNVLSVGGTTLNTSDTLGTYSSEAVWNDTTGGSSRYETEPAYQKTAESTGKRTSPDVAYDANPNTGFAVYDSIPYQGYTG